MSDFERYLIQLDFARLILEDIEAVDSKRVPWTWQQMIERTIEVWRRK